MKIIFLSLGLSLFLCACSNVNNSKNETDAVSSAHAHKLYNPKRLEVTVQTGGFTTSDTIDWATGPIDGYGTHFNSSVTECRSVVHDESGVVVFRKTSCK